MGTTLQRFALLLCVYYLKLPIAQLQRIGPHFVLSTLLSRIGFTSKRAEKLVYVHSIVCLLTTKAPECSQGPTTQWDVDPEDVPSLHERLVDVPLDDDIVLQLTSTDNDEREVRIGLIP
jgi:hypothetical protein